MTTPAFRLRLAALLGLAWLAAFSVAAPAIAQDPAPPAAGARKPLLMAGATSLWQRILTRPGARPSQAPGGPPAEAEIPPLTMLFVYARAAGDGGNWLEVGPTIGGQTLGWLPEAEAIDWKQTLVVNFTNPVNRDRALFFKDSAPLLSIMEAPDAEARTAALRQAAITGTLPPDSPIAAIEPSTWVDPAKNFYLLPILNWTDGYFAKGFPGLALQVAATSLQEAADPPPQAADPGSAAQVMAGYRAGVVFVVDTTVSMDPYLARTRETIRTLIEKLHAEEGDRLSLGLVGFRDVLDDGRPDEYIAKVFAALSDGLDPKEFLDRFDQATVSHVDNRDFREDSFAGVKAALDDIDWAGVAGRLIVLITDASPRRANDPYSSTHLDPDQLRLLAQSKGAAVLVIHLKTAAGKDDHAAAEEAYQPLSDYPNVGSLYFPIEGGDLRTFGSVIDRIAGVMLGQMQAAAKGQVAPATDAPADAKSDDPSRTALARTGLVGRAMQLAYLGRKEGGRVPRLFSSWISDRDIANPARKALDVRVLITKNQLSDLQTTLNAIIDAGEATRVAPNDFFRQLRSAAATMARRPEGVGQEEARHLADLGLIGEYLQGLPYRSRIMELTEDDWLSWSFGQQRQFLDDLQAKATLYQQIYDNTDLWIALDGQRTGGDAVYPMPLDALP
ncbi:vWA domain-containing protein [Inquilinus sp. Marseille-Q2685]|uniref:vWA domain-containing protein n=1 Tax=Inquilinus sp. Marseille-Q2685 TaxID=2866581 RepID=UPI001CE44055|nr:vWA domain-containing protein [Inquilinus sp. Marseille-Q2685]